MWLIFVADFDTFFITAAGRLICAANPDLDSRDQLLILPSALAAGFAVQDATDLFDIISSQCSLGSPHILQLTDAIYGLPDITTGLPVRSSFFFQ